MDSTVKGKKSKLTKEYLKTMNANLKVIVVKKKESFFLLKKCFSMLVILTIHV